MRKFNHSFWFAKKEVRSGSWVDKQIKGGTMGDAKSLMHARWRCKYHMAVALKYRRQSFYGEGPKRNMTKTMWVEGGHIWLEMSPKMSVSAFIWRWLPLFSPSRRFLFPAFSLQSHFLFLFFLHPRVAQSGNGFRSRRAFWGNPRRGGARRLPLYPLRSSFPSFVCFCWFFVMTHDPASSPKLYFIAVPVTDHGGQWRHCRDYPALFCRGCFRGRWRKRQIFSVITS